MQQTLDLSEVKKFASLSTQWCDIEGAFKYLHLMNKVRIPYIKKWVSQNTQHDEKDVLLSKEILDIGCGGGILSIPLCKLGAIVTALDADEESIKVASHYAQSLGININYTVDLIENFASYKIEFDIVCALEILEHVLDVELFLQSACQTVKIGGLIFISTINQTVKSYLQAIVLAEHVLRLVPKATHEWKRFLKPSKIVKILKNYGFKVLDIQGMKLDIAFSQWRIDQDIEVNYILVAQKL